MQDDLFGDLELTTPPEPVLMSLKPEYWAESGSGSMRFDEFGE